MKKSASISMLLFLCSCAYQEIETVQLKNRFDEAEARQLMKSGKNTIEGSAVLRQSNGGIQKCSGNVVALFPATKYAAERIEYLYGNSIEGSWEANRLTGQLNRKYVFNPDEKNYNKYVKYTKCDVDGFFSFSNVADGSFFVIAEVIWSAFNGKNNLSYGGALMQKVTVKGGAVKKIVLSSTPLPQSYQN